MNCSKDETTPSSEVRIRLSNVSEFDFKNITVNTSSGDIRFEDIGSGEMTEYKVFAKACRYAFVKLEAEGSTCGLQPIDYVGETPLEPGNYTYVINASLQEQNCALTLALIEE